MSVSNAELQIPADEILTMLGVRMSSGQVVLHFADGLVQKVETNTVHHTKRRDRIAKDSTRESP